MNLFKRLTSAILCCVLLSPSVLALDDVDNQDFYTLEAVEDGRPSNLSSTATYAGEYSSILSVIATNQNTQISYLSQIFSYISGLADWRNSLSNAASSSVSLLSSVFSSLSAISDKVATEITLSGLSDKVATEITLSGLSDKVATETTLSSFFSLVDGIFYPLNQGISHTYDGSRHRYRIYSPASNSYGYVSFGSYLEEMNRIFTARWTGLSNVTMFSLLQDLRNVLANADDMAIQDQQKANQDIVKDTFLSGSSSGSSLGKDDFGSLSDVGGTFKDITSLNGQASLGGFTDGLSSADETGQGWFSQATKDALDSVSGSSSSVSTFSADGQYMEDVDTYNMKGFEDHYNWLWGDK